MSTTDHLPSVVADLLRDGHNPKWIAFVLCDRTELDAKGIGALLNITPRKVQVHIRHARHSVVNGKDRTEALWQGCDAAFVKYQKEAA